MKKNFKDLSQREILALAVSLEEDDIRTYDDFAEMMRETYPRTAQMFAAMSSEENGHRHRLLELYRAKFGDHIPFIRRQDVKGFLERKSFWLLRPLRPEKVRAQVELMEAESKRFYETAARHSTDTGIRQLLGDLAAEERRHEVRAEELQSEFVPADVEKREEESKRRLFVLQIVQPGLEGLMDGSVSTLAPVFAAALSTGNSRTAFAVGLAASVGAGISMGFAEALSDDGSITGRGHPWVRGIVCGLMTGVGGIGHTLPFLISNFQAALAAAGVVVVAELGVISWIRHRYMETPAFSAALQVGVGGILVFLAGVLIGSS